MKSKSISLSLKRLKDSREDIGIGDVARVLKGIQDSIYHIAEFKLSRDTYRIAGKRNKALEKRSKLHFKELKKGSFIAEIEGDPQATLMGSSIVEDAIETFGDICSTLNTEDKQNMDKKISKKIENLYSRIRIVGDFAEFWPGGDNRYELELKTAQFTKKTLDKKKRPDIKSLAKIEVEIKGEEIFGFLKKLEAGRKKEFEIVTPYGKIKSKFKDKDKEKIRRYWDSIVTISGEMKIDDIGNIKSILDIDEINPLKAIFLERILTDEGELKLKMALEIEISFEENKWMMEHPLLGIVAFGEKYDEVLSEFQEDFYTLYEHYHLKPPKKVTGNAIKIQKFFKEKLDLRGK